MMTSVVFARRKYDPKKTFTILAIRPGKKKFLALIISGSIFEAIKKDRPGGPIEFLTKRAL